MNRFLRMFALLAMSLLPMAVHGQTYELSCPLGSWPIYPSGVTINGSTGNYRQWLCVDYNGNVTGTLNLSGSTAFSAITSGANTQANMQVSTGAQLTPLNVGQVAGSQTWLPAGISSPAAVGGATSSGSLLASHNTIIQVTYVTAAGETLPSNFVQVSNASGGCASNCSVIVTAPTLPSGYTGYTVYECDLSSGTYPTQSCTSPAALQRVTGCINITTNCTITTTTASGVALPTVNSAWVQPPNVQAGSIPYGGLPAWFFPKADGNYYPWLTMNWVDCSNSTGPPLPCGTPLFTHRTFFNDIGAPTAAYPSQVQSFKNAFISINHGAGNGTVNTNQDRALGLLMQNSASDTAGTTHWSMEGVQSEVDLNGAPTMNGSPDGEISAFSGQLSDSHTGGTPNSGLGNFVGRFSFTRQPGAAGGYAGCTSIPCMGGLLIQATSSSASSASNAQMTGLKIQAQGNSSDGMRTSALWIEPMSSANRSSGYNKGLVVNGWLNGFAANASDLAFVFDWINTSTPMKGMMQPTVFFGGQGMTGCGADACPAFASNLLNSSGNISIPIWGTLQPNGGVATSQLSGAVANTDFTCNVTGTTGTNYSYTVVAVDGNNATTAGTSTCTASAAATLNGSNFVTINIKNAFGSIYGHGAVRYDVYRTASAGVPASTGFIGSASCFQQQVVLFMPGSVSICAVNDTGIAATGSTPAVNTTGGIGSAGDFSFTTGKGQHFNTQAANNDHAGVLTCAANTASYTFVRPYTSTPVIVIEDDSTSGGARVSAKSATSFTVTCTGATDTIDYIVVGNPN